EISLKKLSEQFTDTHLNKHPEKKLKDVISCLIENIAPHAVNVASPYFIGHMTSAIPFFMVHLKTIVSALNQNVVKLETSKVVSVIEKQVLAKIHRLIYSNTDMFYQDHVQNTVSSLGVFTEGGTTANLSALWVARNQLLKPIPGFEGVEIDGIAKAYAAHGLDECFILVSKRGHYSLRKAAGVLGIGNKHVIPIDVNLKHQIELTHLMNTINEIKRNPRKAIIAVIGIAGTTETGSVDPLRQIGEICHQHHIYFHVDAAWGGPTLMSEKYRHLLDGISLADSVTIDCHKQFYMPMSCGMVYFKDPYFMNAIEYHSNYVNRMGSVDLGIKSLAGSREAHSLILDCAIKIMGTKGYALLIDYGIELAKKFAQEIEKRKYFRLITSPELNILTYQVCPESLQLALLNTTVEEKKQINATINELNRSVQRIQRESGKSFVSRTVLTAHRFQDGFVDDVVVLRCVLMNPMTTITIINDILNEQEAIFHQLQHERTDPCTLVKEN
ncbi:MAG: aminotransferase class V-fold PLP-dependent enzyme, partial [Desulfobacterales bacterium]|nr:aminotransferase class V-fold PLP-dependent enzyme [Desulfobacterales bacterium]